MNLLRTDADFYSASSQNYFQVIHHHHHLGQYNLIFSSESGWRCWWILIIIYPYSWWYSGWVVLILNIISSSPVLINCLVLYAWSRARRFIIGEHFCIVILDFRRFGQFYARLRMASFQLSVFEESFRSFIRLNLTFFG